MGFETLLGQAPAVQTLERALQSGHVHHAYRFEGPDGVGKELAARRLAQALVCTSGNPLGCETCSACDRALTDAHEPPAVPLHPDVLIVERGLYPPSILGRSTAEVTGISVEQVRRIVLERVGFPPHEGRALCIIIRAADELTVSAANALLKTLEEPPPKTHFILLTSRPHRLLDTVRSRSLAVRFGPLPTEIVAEVLQREGRDPEVAEFAEGSISRAFELAEEDSRAVRDAFVARADEALAAPDLASALSFTSERPAERDELRSLLDHLARTFARRSAEVVDDAPHEAEQWAERYRHVLHAADDIERNGQPALTLEAMITRLRRCGRPPKASASAP